MKAFEVSSGREIWSKKDKGTYNSFPGYYEGKIIYGTTSGRLYARNYLTGKDIYSIDLGATIESPPVFYSGRVFFQTRDHSIFCLDAETGRILWKYKRAVSFLTTVQRVSTPIIYKNKLYVGFADGNIVSLSIEEGVVVWEKKISSGFKFIDVDMTPAISNDKLYIGSVNGNLYILNVNTGEIIKKLSESVSRSPLILDNGHYVIATSGGEVIEFNSSDHVVKRMKVSDAPISGIKNGKLLCCFNNWWRVSFNYFKAR